MFVRRCGLLAGAALATACASGAGAPGRSAFENGEATKQLALEERFAASLEAGNPRAWLKELTAHPHHTGSPGGRRVAENLSDKFRSWGYEARIETYYALISEPRELRLEMVAPRVFAATFEEPPVAGRSPEDREGSLPPFNAYSKDGDVTAEAVYVNYGMPEDYAWLGSQGISVEGKIAVVRYGRVYRGVKPRVAHDHGAVGTIMFSDPGDYGSGRGKVYPDGPFLPDTGHQRGSVLDITHSTGDPMTPGTAVNEPPKSFSPDDIADRISPVPVLPLSAREARPILKAMTGASVPAGWRGGLGIDYRVGGNVKLRLKVSQQWKVVPLHNVVAKLEGAVWPDEWVMHGNNHDAWNYGALVAGSGLVAMLEEARAIGALARSGWRPRRTIVFLAWDGESQGLLGSTEWAEAHAAELKEKAVAYLNTGITTRGWLEAGGSPSLERLVNEVSRATHDPAHDATVYSRWAKATGSDGSESDRTHLEDTGRVRLAALGLGSDFTPFLQHLGIATLDLGFGGEADSGVYNSSYDTFDFFDRFGDPGFEYVRLLAETSGRTVLRLADAEVLPFGFISVSQAVSDYVRELKAIAGDAKLDWSGLDASLRALRHRAAEYTAAVEDGSVVDVAGLNRLLRQAGQKLAPQRGLPGRSWFRHHLFAPGFDTGYAAKTLPGIREPIERGHWDEAQTGIKQAAAVLNAYAGHIQACTGLIEQGDSG